MQDEMLRLKHITVIANKETGEIARERRKEVGVSLNKFAKRIGISPAYLSQLERGLKPWSGEMAGRFLKVLNKIRKEKDGCRKSDS